MKKIINPMVGEMYPCTPTCNSCSGGSPEGASLMFACNYVQFGMTVLDIGAHAGMYSIKLAPRIGTKGKIFAFEPSPNPYKALVLNCQNFPQISTHNIAVWNKNTSVEIDVGGSTAGHYISLPENHAGVSKQTLIKVSAYTLDTYLPKDLKVDFIKMDIEGAEYYALQGMRDILQRNDKIGLIMELNVVAAKAWKISIKDIFDFLYKFNFKLINGEKDYWTSCTNDSIGQNLHFIKG